MSLRPILVWPDARLRGRAEPVVVFDETLAKLAADMLETMYEAPGRGLAATQIGVMQRLFVMDCGLKAGTPSPLVLVNPVVISVSDRRVPFDEGCLSLPGIPARVERPDQVTMRWQGADGLWQERTFSGFEAVCAQHELDHLDGILCIDRLEAEARADVEPALRALEQA